MRPSQYITYQDCLEIAKSLAGDSMQKKLVILSAPKGSVLEAIEEADGSSQLTMSSNNKGEIKVYIADPESDKVIQFKG